MGYWDWYPGLRAQHGVTEANGLGREWESMIIHSVCPLFLTPSSSTSAPSCIPWGTTGMPSSLPTASPLCTASLPLSPGGSPGTVFSVFSGQSLYSLCPQVPPQLLLIHSITIGHFPFSFLSDYSVLYPQMFWLPLPHPNSTRSHLRPQLFKGAAW